MHKGLRTARHLARRSFNLLPRLPLFFFFFFDKWLILQDERKDCRRESGGERERERYREREKASDSILYFFPGVGLCLCLPAVLFVFAVSQ